MKTTSEPKTLEDKVLLLDLDVCDSAECSECEATCANLAHPGNNGIDKLREQATFSYYCRQCEDQACLTACPVDALEKNENGVIERANLLCIGCDSCIMACPFGTIHTDFFPFLDSQCDLCEDRPGEPACVSTCAYGGLKAIPAGRELKGDDWQKLKDDLLVRVSSWDRDLIEKKGGK